eukprot:3852447-Pyramimonas_sp.AAC.1
MDLLCIRGAHVGLRTHMMIQLIQFNDISSEIFLSKKDLSIRASAATAHGCSHELRGSVKRQLHFDKEPPSTRA